MKPRLLILIAFAGGLAVYFAIAPSRPVGEAASNSNPSAGDGRELSEQQRHELITELPLLPLAGDEPEEAANVLVAVDVDSSSGKNRLVLTLSESHGYYVEYFQLRVWYKETPDMDYADSPLRFNQVIDKYIKANESLRDCVTVVPAELNRVGGDIGTSDKWDAEVSSFARARESNPDPLRYRSDDRCGS